MPSQMSIRLIFISLIILSILSCSEKEEALLPIDVYPEINIKLEQQNIEVAQSCIVTIEQEGPVSNELFLSIDNGINNLVIPLKSQQSQTFKIDENLTKHAGNYIISVILRDSVLKHQELLVDPLKAFNAIDQYTGPKTIVANNKTESMVVSIPKDQFDNAIKEGTPITYATRTISKTRINRTDEIKNHKSYQIIPSLKQETTETIGANIESVYSSEQRIDHIPDWPEKIKIYALNHKSIADNRSFSTIKTDAIFDQNNNRIPDGTIIYFHIKDEKNQTSIYNGLTIDGIATCYIKNPKEANYYKIHASTAEGIISNEIDLSFKTGIVQVDAVIFGNKLKIGPLTSELGQFITDGSEIKVIHGNNRYTTQSYQGFAEVELKNFDPNIPTTIFVQVAGRTELIKLN